MPNPILPLVSTPFFAAVGKWREDAPPPLCQSRSPYVFRLLLRILVHLIGDRRSWRSLILERNQTYTNDFRWKQKLSILSVSLFVPFFLDSYYKVPKRRDKLILTTDRRRSEVKDTHRITSRGYDKNNCKQRIESCKNVTRKIVNTVQSQYTTLEWNVTPRSCKCR